jgi:hypothetical protein
MPDGPRKASLRAPTMLERIKSGLQDVVGIPERTWGMPMPDDAILKRRELTENKPTVMRAPTTLERIQDTLRPVTNVLETLGNPLENAEMGPSQAITLARRAAGGVPGRLTGEAELLERLIPRTADGAAIDYREFPKTIDAVADLVKRYPRVASHVNSIDMGPMPQGWAGAMDVPHRITNYIRNLGGDTYRAAVGDPVARIKITPDIESAGLSALMGDGGTFGPAQTLAHEFAHAAQYIADPRRFDGTYDAAKAGVQQMVPSKVRGQVSDPSYFFNPAEVAARAVGRRFASQGPVKPSYADAIADVAPNASMGNLQDVWSRSRESFVDAAKKSGERLEPIRPGKR